MYIHRTITKQMWENVKIWSIWQKEHGSSLYNPCNCGAISRFFFFKIKCWIKTKAIKIEDVSKDSETNLKGFLWSKTDPPGHQREWQLQCPENLKIRLNPWAHHDNKRKHTKFLLHRSLLNTVKIMFSVGNTESTRKVLSFRKIFSLVNEEEMVKRHITVLSPLKN